MSSYTQPARRPANPILPLIVAVLPVIILLLLLITNGIIPLPEVGTQGPPPQNNGPRCMIDGRDHTLGDLSDLVSDVTVEELSSSRADFSLKRVVYSDRGGNQLAEFSLSYGKNSSTIDSAALMLMNRAAGLEPQQLALLTAEVANRFYADGNQLGRQLTLSSIDDLVLDLAYRDCTDQLFAGNAGRNSMNDRVFTGRAGDGRTLVRPDGGDGSVWQIPPRQ